MIRARYVATIFIGAMLLFLVQPMAARMIVPLLGGAPAVWIVCSLCFQALLLGGYGYAHVLGTRFETRTQVLVHLVVVASALFAFPIAVDPGFAKDLVVHHPTGGLILVLLRTVGAPFFVLSTTSPLVQRWFAHRGERDPYHLYAASNAGSMLTLVGYPFVVEPLLGLSGQGRLFQLGYLVFAALVAVSALTTLGAMRAKSVPPQVLGGAASLDAESPRLPKKRWQQRLVWIGLAFVPSTLLLGATEFVTTDVASVPLLWLMPLALYLVSFIVAFSEKPILSAETSARLVGLLAPLVLFIIFTRADSLVLVMTGLHFFFLFAAAVLCHRTLATLRPGVSRLTEFYFLLSLGGALGGVWNGLVAPLAFVDHVEYPLAVLLAVASRVWVMPKEDGPRVSRVDLGVVAFIAVAGVVVYRVVVPATTPVAFGIMLGLLTLCIVRRKRPIGFALALLTLVLAARPFAETKTKEIWASRSFFGVLRVTEKEGARKLANGSTLHGEQSLDPSKQGFPSSYYHLKGPAGDVLGPLPAPTDPTSAPRRVGVIGLGAGELAAYARKGDSWTFFELSPDVVEVARKQFSFLTDAEARGVPLAIEVGDARVRIESGPGDRFDVLVLDAFSSDAIPVHLLTREALGAYKRALAADGVLLLHLSNRHLVLPPVVAGVAHAAGMTTTYRADTKAGFDEVHKAAATWAVVSSGTEARERLVAMGNGWTPLEPTRGQAVWTDDYANLLGAMRFRF